MRPKRPFEGPYFESEAAASVEEEKDPLTENELRVYRKAKESEKTLPTFSQWLDVYPSSVMKADIKETEEMKKRRPEMERPARSVIAEYALAEEIYNYDLLGKHCNTYRTSEHDNICNHTDLVIEWKEDD